MRLTLLSLNDFHGQLDPVIFRSSEEPPRRFRVGGAEALAATIAELRRDNPGGALLVDVGDSMQGTLLSNHFEGAPVADLFNLLGVAAATVGNHEFDYGPVGSASSGGQDPRGALKAWAKRAAFPLLTANVRRPAGEAAWPNILPTVVLERAGVRVGLIGLTTRETPRTTLAANVADLRFEPLLPALRAQARALRARGVEVVVLLGHLDGQCSGPAERRRCDGELFELLDRLAPGEIDVAFAGHAHRCWWHRHTKSGVLTVEACSKGLAVGRVELWVKPGGGVIAERSRALSPRVVCHDVFSDTGDCEGLRRQGPRRGKLVNNPLLAKHRPAVATARALVARYAARAPSLRHPVFSLPRRLEHRWAGRSEVGLLFATAMRRAVPGAHVALINAGGIRGHLPRGPVSFADFYRVHPFDNRLATAALRGNQLVAMLRAMIERPNAGLPSAVGLRLTVTCGSPRRLVAVSDEQGRPLDPKHRYLVVLSDFMLHSERIAAILAQVPQHLKKTDQSRFIREVVGKQLAAGIPELPPPAALRLVGDNCRNPGARVRSPRSICR